MHAHASKDADTETPEMREYSVMVGRFECRLVDETSDEERSWRTNLRLTLPFEFFDVYHNVSEYPRIEMPEGVSMAFTRIRVDVVSADGNVLFSADDYFYLPHAYKMYIKKQKAEQLRQEIDSLDRRFYSLPLEKKPQSHPVRGLIREARRIADSYTWVYRAHEEHAKALEMIRRISCILDDLENTDALEIAIEQLMSGKWPSTVHRRNLATVSAINAASVRTGGFIDTFDEKQMREFYRQQLTGLADPLSHLDDGKLLLKLDDYAPEDVIYDPDVDAAPLVVQLLGNKGVVAYDVTYRYDGDQPTAIVQLPLKVYQRIAPEHGKKHGLPELPHGICWAVEVVFDGKVIAEGLLDLELGTKVDKCLRARKRSKHAEDRLDSFLYASERGEVPPWYVGKTKPGRRR